jgi:hypothetical protein
LGRGKDTEMTDKRYVHNKSWKHFTIFWGTESITTIILVNPLNVQIIYKCNFQISCTKLGSSCITITVRVCSVIDSRFSICACELLILSYKYHKTDRMDEWREKDLRISNIQFNQNWSKNSRVMG